MKKISLFISLLSMVTALVGCGNSEDLTEEIASIEQSETVLEEVVIPTAYESATRIINEYSSHKEQIPNDISVLKSMNPSLGLSMERIIHYWDQINEDDFLYTDGLPSNLPEDDSLCLVVLGFQLNPDGSMRDELIGRLETALSAYKQYPNAYLLVTGGGTARDNPSATEADAMASWLIENGVKEEQIIIENLSRTTTENALFSYAILRDDYPSVTGIAIISSEYHVPLGCLLFEGECLFNNTEDYDLHVISNTVFLSGENRGYSLDDQAKWVLDLYNRQ